MPDAFSGIDFEKGGVGSTKNRIPPAWIFFHTNLSHISATKIRSETISSFIGDRDQKQTTNRSSLFKCCRRITREVRAQDIVKIDLSGKTSIADLCSSPATSSRQIRAMAEHTVTMIKKNIKAPVNMRD